MGGFSSFAISFSIISVLTGPIVLYGYGLSMAGPREMTLGWPVVSLFALTVAASMGELASAIPTSGGTYHWSAAVGGPQWGWFNAWFNIIGTITALAGVDYGCARFALPLLALEASTRVILIAYGLVLLSHGLINQYGIRLVAWVNEASVALHVGGVVLIVAGLLLFAPKQPATFLLQGAGVTPAGASPYWWPFLLGMLGAQWTFTGYDGSANVAEETLDPRRRAPRGIVMAVASSAVAGYLLLIAVTLAIPDLPSMIQAGAEEKPVPVLVFAAALGARAGAALSWLVVIAMWLCGLSVITSISRMIYSFARDGGIPQALRLIHPVHHTPHRAIWATAVAAFLSLAWGRAFVAVTSLSTVILCLAYAMPVALALRAGRGLARGPWHLGRWSTPVRVVAICWTAFICVILVMPPNQIAGQSLAVVLIALVCLYWLHARRAYRGPAWLRGLETAAPPEPACGIVGGDTGVVLPSEE